MPPPANEPGRAERAGADPQTLVGSVEVVTFHNADSLYTVLKIAPEAGYSDPGSRAMFRETRLVAVGSLPSPAVGQRLRLFGRWVSHPSHGRQFEFEAFESLPPADAAGLVRYLSSQAFEGVGETLAARIVERLGERALERIRDEPGALDGVRGLKGPVRAALEAAVRREFATHQLHAFLRGAGLGPRQAAAVVRKLGADCEADLRRDPYRIAGQVAGIGFAIADQFALRLGLARDSVERVRAGILHCLRDAAGDGHSMQEREELEGAVRDLLAAPLTAADLSRALQSLQEAGDVRVERVDSEGPELVYLPWLAASEAGVAASVRDLASRAEQTAPLATEADLERMEASSGLQLHKHQRSAVLGLLRSPLALLTGGPGVGKTTIVRWVVGLARAHGARIRLASPTGRAAKRLAEATGEEAATVHRLLGWDPAGGKFLHGASNPLDCDLLVVDEISMLDIVLAHHLLKAVAAPTRVVLVGDPDQLPSVGPGNVLADLIASGCLPVHRLTEVFRQQGGSLIVENAHRIQRGEEPRLPERGDRTRDFYFFPAEDPAEAADRVIEVVTRRVPESFGLSWIDDVQVLAPMYRGDCGVDALNDRLREALDQPGRELQAAGRLWRVGDRVVQTRNDYEKEVFNGDMGRVARISEDGTVLVRYPEREVPYTPDQLGDLQPAFAITVHRSQGSEYPAVVLPLVMAHAVMLERNLLYTAITRARRLLVLIGSRRALRLAIENSQPSRRRSALAARLRGSGTLRLPGFPAGE